MSIDELESIIPVNPPIVNKKNKSYCSSESRVVINFSSMKSSNSSKNFNTCRDSNNYSCRCMGIILFIVSEILFFFSFFWAYFHSSLSPAIEIGQSWPPLGIIPFNPFDIPLLNTIILVSSGLTVTWSHHAILNNNYKERTIRLLITILLGIYFSALQLIEYIEAPFTISDSVYGSRFFVATGFHGLHVIIGTIFLFFTFYRINLLHFSSIHHFGFEAAAWYWHFVDVVWLFLYVSIYWWRF